MTVVPAAAMTDPPYGLPVLPRTTKLPFAGAVFTVVTCAQPENPSMTFVETRLK
jgi:hypothetical protein